MTPTPEYPFEGACGECRQVGPVRENAVVIGKERLIELICKRCDEQRTRDEEARRAQGSA